MTTNQSSESDLRISSRRTQFFISSVVIISLFLSTVVFAALAWLAALQLNWGLSSTFWFFGLIPLFIGAFLVGGWLSMLVIIGSTHPVHKPHHWRWINFGLFTMLLITITVWNWAFMGRLYNREPDYLFLNSYQLPVLIVYNFIVTLFIAAASATIWYKWLKPITKE